MLAQGQRGRRTRWKNDHPGVRGMPKQGEGPQPMTECGYGCGSHEAVTTSLLKTPPHEGK